jgi:hypothetical protein
VKEMAVQNVWQHYFLVWGVGRCGTNWSTEVVEMAKLCEFDENDTVDSSLPSVTNIRVTLSDFFFTRFTLKRIQKMALKKNA